MDANTYTVELVKSLVNLIVGIAWPVAVLVLVITFRRQVGELLNRLREGEGFGVKAKFDPSAVEPAVEQATEATATTVTVADAKAATAAAGANDATVNVREPLAVMLAQAAEDNPRVAVLAAWSDVEKALKGRLRARGVKNVDQYAGARLIAIALGELVINHETLVALDGLLRLRNVAAHGEDVDVARAREFIALCDAVIFAIESYKPRDGGSQPD